MKKSIKYLALLAAVFSLTGCTTYLKTADNQNVKNSTGQQLTENILCRPTDEETIKIYLENGVDLEKLPNCSCSAGKFKDDSLYKKDSTGSITESVVEETGSVAECKEYTVTTGGYEGLWTSVFVKPLAWVILSLGELTGNFGFGLIITSILIRLVAIPLTSKSARQTEGMKKAQPELTRLEQKYANKDQNDREVMMMKSQEMMAIYKKYDINPISGCLFSFIQLPLFIAFLEAINRIPAIFEENMFGIHLGTSPSIAIANGDWWYLLIIVFVGLTTYFSFKNTSTAGNDETARQTKMMTNGFLVMIIVMSIFMTSALGIYWATSNLFTIVQQYIIKRRMK